MAEQPPVPVQPAWLTYRDEDPFVDDVPMALLSREHIIKYAERVEMISPFDASNTSKLKAASFEMDIGREVWRWKEGSKPVCEKIEDGHLLYLEPNSITFVQIAQELRLPLYIAMRFNLKIRFVHSGILLGTGPLVDPGYKGNLLIPLHNLTDSVCAIDPSEGLIWAEFTKTSYKKTSFGDAPPIDPNKISKPPSWWFKHANGGNPIRSSIPVAVKSAEQAAKEASAYVQTLTLAGVIAIFLGSLGIFQLMQDVNSNVAQSNAVSDAARVSLIDAEQKLKDLRDQMTRDLERSRQSSAQSLLELREALSRAESRLATLEAKLN